MRVVILQAALAMFVATAVAENSIDLSAFVEVPVASTASAEKPLPPCPSRASTSLYEPNDVRSKLTDALLAWGPQAPVNARVAPRVIVEADARYGGSFASVASGGPLQMLPEKEGRLVVAATAKLTHREQLEPWREDFDLAVQQMQIAEGLAAYRVMASRSSPRTALATLRSMQAGAGSQILNAERIVHLQPALKNAISSPISSNSEQKILLSLDDTNAIVVPDSPTRPGVLGGAPNGIPVALGYDEAGRECIRAAENNDFKMDAKTGRTGILWDPSTYPEVGQIHAFRTDGITINTCSVVMLSPAWAITAAHCVIKKIENGEGYEWMPGMKEISGERPALIFFPRVGEFRNFPLRACRSTGSEPDCRKFHIARLTSTPIFPEYPRWNKGVPVPIVDIALLPIEFTGDPPSSSLEIGEPEPNEDVQIVGFGLSNALGPTRNWLIERASQIVTHIDQATFGWVPNGELSGSACLGDSGAPVYRGWSNNPKDRKQLLGIVSGGYFKYASETDTTEMLASYCGDARVSVVKLNNYLDWICAHAAESGFCGISRGNRG